MTKTAGKKIELLSLKKEDYLKDRVGFLPALTTTMCQNPSQESFMSF